MRVDRSLRTINKNKVTNEANDLDIRLVGILGDVLYIDISGHRYGYVELPKDSPDYLPLATVKEKFSKMLLYSRGKALAWIKKKTKLATGSKKEHPWVESLCERWNPLELAQFEEQVDLIYFKVGDTAITEDTTNIDEWFPGKQELYFFTDLIKTKSVMIQGERATGIVLDPDLKLKARRNLMELISIHGAKINKSTNRSVTDIFIPIEMEGEYISGIHFKVTYIKKGSIEYLQVEEKRVMVTPEEAKKVFNSRFSEFYSSEGPF